jgi:hypothetical protein
MKYVCVNGHDRCAGSIPGPDCPYCERRSSVEPSAQKSVFKYSNNISLDNFEAVAKRAYERTLLTPGFKINPDLGTPTWEELPKKVRDNWVLLAQVFKREFSEQN